MGEYIEYKGETVKIGTCESMYYATYPQYLAALVAGFLSAQYFETPPETYARPDSGFRFRFPFPDEDHIPIGSHSDFDRGVPIKIDAPIGSSQHPVPAGTNATAEIEIVQQKLVHREEDGKLCLALVIREPSTKEMFRIEDDAEIKRILNGIAKYHISGENDPLKKNFYRILGARILKGYRLNLQPHEALQIGEAKQPLKKEYKDAPAIKGKKMRRR